MAPECGTSAVLENDGVSDAGWVPFGMCYIGTQSGQLLVEVHATVQNKGSVRHEVDRPRLEIRYLRESDELSDGGDEIHRQANFPHTIGKRDLPWGGYIDPGLEYRNSYVTRLPADATFALILCRFSYGDEELPAQRAVALSPGIDEPVQT